MVDLYYFKAMLTEEQPIFYLLTGASICRQKTFAIFVSALLIYNSCKYTLRKQRPHLVQMRENAEQNHSEYGQSVRIRSYISHSDRN